MSKSLVDMIETYRKTHNIKIDTFVEGITSSYSYYRYIKHPESMPLDICLALIENTSYYHQDLFAYLQKLDTTTLSLEPFLLAYINGYQEDMKRLTNIHETQALKGIQKIYYELIVLRDQYEHHEISIDGMKDFLERLQLSQYEKDNDDTLYVYAIYAMQYALGIEIPYRIKTLISRITDKKWMLKGPELFIASHDIFTSLTLEKIQSLGSVFLEHVVFIYENFVKQKMHLGYAYHAYYLKVIESYLGKDVRALTHYAIKVLQCKQFLHNRQTFDVVSHLNQLLSIDIHTLIKEAI